MEPLKAGFVPFDQEWLLVNAIRQAFGIARRGTITYAEAVALTRELAPKLLRKDSPLVEAFESELVRLYRERAEARSKIEHRDVTPLEMLDLDIYRLEEEMHRSGSDESQAIESQLRRLRRARSKLDEASWTESQAIGRDADILDGELPISHKGQGYKEYLLPKDRRLRVRVLHPDPPEWISGVDLMYETYYNKKTDNQRSVLLVRMVALQYKMWDGKALYTSKVPDLKPKMDKMHQVFCQAGLCNPPSTPDSDERYRLPPCCAFLRPTDIRQTRDAWRITHAWHVPICKARELFEPTDKGHEVLRSKMLSSQAVTQDTFQELYNRSMLGSRWMNAAELGELYDRIGIFNDLDRVVVHTQEYSPTSVPRRRRRRTW